MVNNATPELILQPPFQHGGGSQWTAYLPPSYAEPSDTNDAPAMSRLRLWENGKPLGPRHAFHAVILQEGGGRYSHWDGVLLFSTSDGSDPNSNGRQYTASVGEATPLVLGVGSCHLHGMIALWEEQGLAWRTWQSPVLSYSPREALQLIQSLGNGSEAHRGKHPLGANLVFLEFGSSTDIAFESAWISRFELLRSLVEPISTLGDLSRRTAHRWYYQGLLQQNEAVRREYADRLLEFIPYVDVDQKLAGDIVREAYGATQDPDAMKSTILDILGALGTKAVCVLSGNSMTWPVNFPAQLDSICDTLGLPLLHPTRLVAERGGAFSLEADLLHFTPQFLALLSRDLFTMGQQTLVSLPGEADERCAGSRGHA